MIIHTSLRIQLRVLNFLKRGHNACRKIVNISHFFFDFVLLEGDSYMLQPISYGFHRY